MSGDPAINHLLQRFGELEERVARLERGASSTSPSPGAEADGLAPSAYVRELVVAGKTVQAIREYRKETGLGLVDAKRQIDALM